MQLISVPVEHVRFVLTKFPNTNGVAGANAARLRLLLALQLSMRDTQPYALTEPGEITSIEPEALYSVLPPAVTVASVKVLEEIVSALGGALSEAPQTALWLGAAWTPIEQVGYPPATACAVEYLPRALEPLPTTPPAPVVAAPPPAAPEPPPAEAVPWEPRPLALAVFTSLPTEGPGRPTKSPFQTPHPERTRKGAAPAWVGRSFDMLPDVLVVPPQELVNRNLSSLEAYGVALALAQRSLVNLDPELSVGQVLHWLRLTTDALLATPAGPAIEAFVLHALTPAAEEKE